MGKTSKARKAVIAGLTVLMASGGIVSVPVMAMAAAGETPAGNVTINATEGIEQNLTGYRIFDAAVSADGSKGSDFHWTSDAMMAAVEGVIKETDTEYAGTSAQEAVDFIQKQAEKVGTTGGSTTSADAVKFMNKLANAVKGVGDAPTVTAVDGVAAVKDEGFWLFCSAGKDATAPIFIGVGNDGRTVNLKASVPTVHKEITNQGVKNDGKDYNAQGQEVINYKVTGTVSQFLDKFDTYSYTFNDVILEGINYNGGSVKVEAVDADGNAKDITATFTNISYGNDNHKLSVGTDNLKAAGDDVDKDSKIVLTYKGTVVDAAKVASYGTKGDVNEVDITYSSNPLEEGTTSTTEKDDAEVNTSKLTIHKIDRQKQTDLAGAKFTIAIGDQFVQADGSLAAEAHEFVTDDAGVLSVAGLKDGTYTIHETVAPEGYDLCKDFTVTIADGTATSTKTNEGDSFAADAEVNNTSYTATVTDAKKVTMPITGLDGVTATWIAGAGVTAFGLARMLRSKRKADAEE